MSDHEYTVSAQIGVTTPNRFLAAERFVADLLDIAHDRCLPVTVLDAAGASTYNVSLDYRVSDKPNDERNYFATATEHPAAPAPPPVIDTESMVALAQAINKIDGPDREMDGAEAKLYAAAAMLKSYIDEFYGTNCNGDILERTFKSAMVDVGQIVEGWVVADPSPADRVSCDGADLPNGDGIFIVNSSGWYGPYEPDQIDGLGHDAVHPIQPGEYVFKVTGWTGTLVDAHIEVYERNPEPATPYVSEHGPQH